MGIFEMWVFDFSCLSCSNIYHHIKDLQHQMFICIIIADNLI
jgi:hypothetical protein